MFPNPFHLVHAPWGKLKLVPDKYATIILDNKQIHLDHLSKPVTGKVAYIGGANEESFLKVCALVAAERMDFFEMRVTDISALARISRLRHLAIRWNTKVRSLDSLSGLGLRSLILEETPRLQRLEPIATLGALSYLRFAGGMSKPNIAESLTPLSKLRRLTHLDLFNLRVRRGGLFPLAKCRRLQLLGVSNQFPTKEYAFLSIRIPKTKCTMFSAWVRNQNGGKDVMVVGRGKPFLSSKKDRESIRRYERSFAKLQAEFAANKSLERTRGR
jgi:hypothetical protein